MKYLKKYEGFYTEDFQTIKENFGKRESEEDETSGDQAFDDNNDKSQSSDIPAEVETPSVSGSEGGSGHDTTQSSDIPAEVETASMSNSEGGSGHNTTVDSNPPAEVLTSTMESVEEVETVNEEEAVHNEECDCGDEDCSDCNCSDEKIEEGVNEEEVEGTEKVDEGVFRKFVTGHESSEDRDTAMASFHKALDDAQSEVEKAPEKFVFNRESLEAKAKDNNYRGGLRIQQGGRDKSRVYVVYDDGATGFQQMAAGASHGRKNSIGM